MMAASIADVVHRNYVDAEIQPRHFLALADDYPGAEAWPAMIELASRVEEACAIFFAFSSVPSHSS